MPVTTTPVLVLVAAATAPTAVKDVAEYVCDGAADQTEITAALAAVAATGGLVQLTPGTFSLSGSVTFPVSTGVQLRGSGWGTVLQVGSGMTSYAVAFSTTAGNVMGATLAEFKVDANGSAAGAGSGGIYAKGAVQCLVDHVWVRNPVDAGLWLHEISGGVPGHHNRVRDCLFDATVTVTGHGMGVRMQASDENWITGCDFESWGGSGSEPYAVKDWAGSNHIAGNVFVGGQEAIRVQDTSGSKIIGNMFDGVGRSCVHISGSGCVVRGNVFSGGGQASAGTYSHIVQDGTGQNVIGGNHHATDATNGRLRSFVRELGASVAGSVVAGNRFIVNGSLGTAKVERNAQVNTYRDNAGYVTEAKGTSSVASGTTSIAVTHGLDVTPATSDILITPTNNPTNNVRHWVSATSSTTFTVTTSADPGASGLAFAWQAQVL